MAYIIIYIIKYIAIKKNKFNQKESPIFMKTWLHISLISLTIKLTSLGEKNGYINVGA